jgi:hypothetical protein
MLMLPSGRQSYIVLIGAKSMETDLQIIAFARKP